MKAYTVLALLVLTTCLSPSPAYAQSLRDMANELSSAARQLSDEAYDGFVRRDRGNRADVEALYVTLQFRASAELFERMVQDNRPATELRDSVNILRSDLMRMDRYAFGRTTRARLATTVDNMGRQMSGRQLSGDTQSYGSGRMRWSGRVDDEVMVLIRGNQATTRVLRGDRIRDENYDFDSPLPRRELNARVKRVDGRGSVEIVEQPSRRNEYSAVVRIRDSKGGSDGYVFELTW